MMRFFGFTALLLLTCLAMATARPSDFKKHMKKGRKDLVLRSRDHGFAKTEQGECPEGWKDGSSVGLGCVFADLGDANVDEPTAEEVCSNLGEGGRYENDEKDVVKSMILLII